MKKISKVHPTHKVWFADDQTQNGYGVEVGVVWPRKNNKQGGILKWSLSPSMLGAGAWRLVSNETNAPTNTYTISFAQKQDETGKLGRPVKVASVGQDLHIQWSIAPEKLANNEGAFFVLADHTPQEQEEILKRPNPRFNTDHGTGA